MRNADCLSCEFQRRNRLIPAHRRKLLQELIERIARLEIVEKVVKGNARSDKDQLATHDLRVAVHDLFFRIHASDFTPVARVGSVQWTSS